MNSINKLPLNVVIPSILFVFFIVLQGTIFFVQYQHAQQKLYNEKAQYIKGIAAEALADNAYVCLEKPLNYDDLLTMLTSLIKRNKSG